MTVADAAGLRWAQEPALCSLRAATGTPGGLCEGRGDDDADNDDEGDSNGCDRRAQLDGIHLTDKPCVPMGWTWT